MVRTIISFILCKIRGEYTLKKLVKMGLKIGTNFAKENGVIIDPSHCWLIEIGDNVTLAPRVHILAHDASTKFYLGYAKIGKVTIGNNVFIGAGTTILPNVRIGDNVIVGANSTVTKSLENGFVYAGCPVKKICSIEQFIDKNKHLMKTVPCYGDEYTIRKKVDDIKKRQMLEELNDTFGFVR